MRAKTIKDIGLMIRQRRRDLGMGQSELAARVGVSRQWIIAIENGKDRIAADLLIKTLAALGLDLDIAVNPSDAATAPHDINAIITRARNWRK